MGTPMEVTNAIEPLDRQRQGGPQPAEEQAVGLMVADMLQAVAVLGVVETLVLDFPAALADAEYFAAADPLAREVGKPERFDHLAVRLVLAKEGADILQWDIRSRALTREEG